MFLPGILGSTAGTHCDLLTVTATRNLVIIQYKINMVLRRIFGPRRDEVTGEWRR